MRTLLRLDNFLIDQTPEGMVTLAYSVCTLSVEAINGSLLPMRDCDGLLAYSIQMK